MAARGCEQFVFAGCAGERDSAQNASTGRGDLLIGGSGNALLELRGAVARKDQMGVRINKARRDASAFRINELGVQWDFSVELRVRTSSSDAAVFDEVGGILD
jgi:hypothetical protein